MNDGAAGGGSGERGGSPPHPLAAIVRGEALRADAGERIRPDPVRVAAGWERRFVIEAPRAADLVRVYEEAGFEVALDPVAPELLADECTDCKLVSAMQYVQVYVRRAAPR